MPFIRNNVYKRKAHFTEHQSLEREADSNESARVKAQARREKAPAIVNIISDKWYKAAFNPAEKPILRKRPV
jgi:hypothetical protein